MKTVRILALLLFVASFFGNLKADVVAKGEVDVHVELMNGKAFPGFTFFIRYQEYHYDRGWKLGATKDVKLEPGQAEATSSRSSASLLYANDKKGHKYVSKETIGGVTNISDSDESESPNISNFVDQIEIVSVKKGVVTFKVVARVTKDAEGNVTEINRGEFGGNWVLFALPIACLLGLLAFFLFRRKLQL